MKKRQQESGLTDGCFKLIIPFYQMFYKKLRKKYNRSDGGPSDRDPTVYGLTVFGLTDGCFKLLTPV
jgi:hypothetical protein